MKTTVQRASRLIERMSASPKCKVAHSSIESIRLCSAYAEPGYTNPECGCIAFGNWNKITRWNRETQQSETIDKTMPRIAQIFERWGIECEWEDEWTECADCGRAIRTQPDSYSWTRSFVETDDGACCEECTAKNAADYLESIEGNDHSALTLDSIDPTDHSYRLLTSGYENGFHPGQNADPVKIGNSLRARGITRYLFRIDSVGQFDATFSVFVHESQFPEETTS